MQRKQRLNRLLGYSIAAAITQEIAFFVASIIQLVKGRTDLACYCLLLSMWIMTQINGFAGAMRTKLEDMEEEGGTI